VIVGRLDDVIAFRGRIPGLTGWRAYATFCQRFVSSATACSRFRLSSATNIST
jgi:hypothetical protein